MIVTDQKFWCHYKEWKGWMTYHLYFVSLFCILYYEHELMASWYHWMPTGAAKPRIEHSLQGHIWTKNANVSWPGRPKIVPYFLLTVVKKGSKTIKIHQFCLQGHKTSWQNTQNWKKQITNLSASGRNISFCSTPTFQIRCIDKFLTSNGCCCSLWPYKEIKKN